MLAGFLAACPLGAATAHADRVLFDFEGPYLYQPGFTVKDHDLVSDGAQWHAFYIRGTEGVPGTASEVQLGHATSTDLCNWIVLPPVLNAGPETWDLRRVWAPDVRSEGPGWSMYYTGVDPQFLQRMGAATSLNLSDWTKDVQNPVVEPDSTVYLWSPDLDNPELSAFRDPFRFEYGGQTHLLNTALIPDATLAAGFRGAIHHLVDDGMGGWTDAGPLALNNNNAIGAWRELESVQLIQAQGRWNLFFTFFGLGGVYWVGNDELDDLWDISTAVKIDPGVGAEITDTGTGKWLFTRHGSAAHAVGHPHPGQVFFVLRADSLEFNAGNAPPTVVHNTSFEQKWPEHSGLAFVSAPTFGDNSTERGDDPIGQVGHGYLSSRDLYDGPFGLYGAPGAELGVSATGSIHSEWFAIAADDSVMTMRIAGPVDLECKVRIVERVSEAEAPLVTAALDSLYGNGLKVFSNRVVDVRSWRGRTVRLEVEDLSEFAWIALDQVRMLSSNPVATAAPAVTPAARGQLLPNQPNPFNPRTVLKWSLQAPAEVRIELFDLRGRRVARFEPGRRSAGTHSLVLDASGLASGTYLVRLLADGIAVDHQKISLIR